MFLTFKNLDKYRVRVNCKDIPLLEEIVMRDPEWREMIEDMRQGKEDKRIKTFIRREELVHMGKEIYDYWLKHYEDGKKRLSPYFEFGLLSLPNLLSKPGYEFTLIINVSNE